MGVTIEEEFIEFLKKELGNALETLYYCTAKGDEQEAQYWNGYVSCLENIFQKFMEISVGNEGSEEENERKDN